MYSTKQQKGKSVTEKQPSQRNGAGQRCYLTSVIATSVAKNIQTDAASVTQTAATATNSRSANGNGRDAVSGERVTRLCIAPLPKAN